MSSDVIYTITPLELEHLLDLFQDYQNDEATITELEDYKRELAEKYNYTWNKVTINSAGEVRLMQQGP